MPPQINRLVFLIHPLTWSSSAHRPDFAAPYQEYVDCEKRVKERWWQGIADMASKPDEALIIGSPDCPRELEEYATAQLGDRALILYHPSTGRRIDIGRFYSPPRITGPIRCDLHPRWSRDGRQVCIDSVHEGTRGMYGADVSGIVGI